ncbi:hypothetical protein QAD02_002445 [Eretmocerus hayati]|uniref:Uncharacterized protein n=1 Tax=Eretmocerus hayati TaxID=131215 RepID=A0ACC2NKN8_9HYME|nr:hypothetical protein QAD02_002445 [Eretmocerus hayati]
MSSVNDVEVDIAIASLLNHNVAKSSRKQMKRLFPCYINWNHVHHPIRYIPSAWKRGSWQRLLDMIERFGIDVNPFASRSISHRVCSEKDLVVECKSNIVKRLLQSNARVNVVDSFDNNPLFYAVKRMNSKVIQQLAKRGANVLITTANGHWSSVHGAIFQCQVEINIPVVSQYLRVGRVGGNRLLRAAQRVLPDDERCVNIELFKYLVNVGCDVNNNKQDNRGQTPFDLSVEIKCYQMVEILLKNDADVCPRDLMDPVPEFFSVPPDNSSLIFIVRLTAEELRSRNLMMSHVVKLVSASMPTPKLNGEVYQLLEEGNPYMKNQRDIVHGTQIELSITGRIAALESRLHSATRIADIVRKTITKNQNSRIIFFEAESASRKRYRSIVVGNISHLEPQPFLIDAKPFIGSYITKLLRQFKSLKAELIFHANFLLKNDEKSLKNFREPYHQFHPKIDVSEWYNTGAQSILERIYDFDEMKSRWALEEIIDIKCNIVRTIQYEFL